jgi:hypothetical protein
MWSQVGPPPIRKLDHQPAALHVLPGGFVPTAAEVSQDLNTSKLLRACPRPGPVNDVIPLVQVETGVDDRKFRTDDSRRAWLTKPCYEGKTQRDKCAQGGHEDEEPANNLDDRLHRYNFHSLVGWVTTRHLPESGSRPGLLTYGDGDGRLTPMEDLFHT